MGDVTPLTLGISPCPNDTFAFAGLVRGTVGGPTVRTTYADIDVLNGQAGAASLDVVKVSTARSRGCSGTTRCCPVVGRSGAAAGPSC